MAKKEPAHDPKTLARKLATLTTDMKALKLRVAELEEIMELHELVPRAGAEAEMESDLADATTQAHKAETEDAE